MNIKIKLLATISIIICSNNSYAWNLFGPNDWDSCKKKYVTESNRVYEVKRSFAFACNYSFNREKFLTEKNKEDNYKIHKAAKCYINKYDEVLSPDTAIIIATKCAEKHDSKIFPSMIRYVMYQHQRREGNNYYEN